MGCHSLRPQAQRAAKRDGFETVCPGIKSQITTGAGSSACNIARAAIDTAREAFVIQN